jgi:PPOX class probable F420-dependent enzyme
VRITEAAARERFAAARVARLATVGHDGRPHLVPVTFALDGPGSGNIYIAIDHKPKTTVSLRRLRNIRDNPYVTLLADHYDEDWRQLWWVRVDGRAHILDETGRREHPLDVLAQKYAQYRDTRPAGPVIVIEPSRFTGWDGAE